MTLKIILIAVGFLSGIEAAKAATDFSLCEDAIGSITTRLVTGQFTDVNKYIHIESDGRVTIDPSARKYNTTFKTIEKADHSPDHLDLVFTKKVMNYQHANSESAPGTFKVQVFYKDGIIDRVRTEEKPNKSVEIPTPGSINHDFYFRKGSVKNGTCLIQSIVSTTSGYKDMEVNTTTFDYDDCKELNRFFAQDVGDQPTEFSNEARDKAAALEVPRLKHLKLSKAANSEYNALRNQNEFCSLPKALGNILAHEEKTAKPSAKLQEKSGTR